VKRTGMFLLIAFAALLPQAASATKPTREPLPFEDREFAAGEVCPFPVGMEVLVNREKLLTFSDGRQQISGTLKLRLINRETGESLVVNASGPATATIEGNLQTFEARGPLWLFLFPGEPGGPGMFLYKGNTTFTLDLTTGAVTSIVSRGTRRDLCAELA
jgi:hypothetical protein